MTHILKYIVEQNLGQGRTNVVIFIFFVLYLIIFYTTCIIAAALKTDASLAFSRYRSPKNLRNLLLFIKILMRLKAQYFYVDYILLITNIPFIFVLL